jgi:hypothetical protein
LRTGSFPVAQVFNLLYRGFSIRQPQFFQEFRAQPRPAGYNPAIQQIGNLRYDYGLIVGNSQNAAFADGRGQNRLDLAGKLA